MAAANSPVRDAGYVVVSGDGAFWAGYGWKKQLRQALVYHWESKARDIADAHPGSTVVPVEIRIIQ